MGTKVRVKLGRQGDPVGVRTAGVRGNKIPNDLRDDAVDKPGRKLRGPLANRRAGAANALPDAVGVAAEQGEGSRFLHGADDLTLSATTKQTSSRGARNQSRAAETPVDAGRRQETSRLIDRLDKAMREAQVSGPRLAAELGIKPQSFTNLRRKANGGMRAELLAVAARYLRCDLHWLCTGEGGDYVPKLDLHQRIAEQYMALILRQDLAGLQRFIAWLPSLQQGFAPSWPIDGGTPPQAGGKSPRPRRTTA